MAATQPQWTADALDSTAIPPVSKKPTSSRSKLRTSCDTCQQSKVKCNQAKPCCHRCLQHGIDCVYSPVKRVGRPPKPTTANVASSEGSEPPRVATETRVESSQTPQKTPVSAQDDITGWNFAAMDLDFRYPTPQSISRMLSDSSLSAAPAEWEICSAEKPTDEFPALTFGQGESESYGDLNKFFEDSHQSLSSAYTTTSNPFDTLWDFPTEGEVQNSSMDCDATAILNFKALDTKVGDLGVPVHHGQQLSNSNESSGGATIRPTSSKRQNHSTSRKGDTVGSRNPAKSKLGLNIQPQALSQIQAPASPLSSDTSTIPVKCCQLLIKTLFQLSEGLAANSGPPPLDIVLRMDREMHLHKDRVLNCTSCGGNNRSSILLLTMVMERLVEVLERRKGGCTNTGTQPMSGHSRGYSGSGTQVKRRQGQRDSYTSPPVHPLLDTDCPLLIGDFEVNDETKWRFLKRLWKFQLQALLSLLKEIEQAVNVDLKDINHRLAKEMVVEVRRRLESLTGSLEMWG